MSNGHKLRRFLAVTTTFVVGSYSLRASHAQAIPALGDVSVQPQAQYAHAETISVIASDDVSQSALSDTTSRHSVTQVTVVSGDQLRGTGESNVTSALAQLSPSITSPPQGGVGGNAFVQTMQLRGLSADDTLILVNGKRRHVGANFNANTGPNLGTDPADISLIPISAIDHVEIITEGATALYGQDAIAGAINIVLKKDTTGGTVRLHNSGFYPGDGQAFDGSGSYGFALGDNGGYLDLSGQVTRQQPTNRSGLYNGTLYLPLANGQPDPRNSTDDRNLNEVLGIPRSTLETFAGNLSVPLTQTLSLYNTTTYSHRDAAVEEGYRSAADDQTVRAIWPNGMQPYIALDQNDFQVNNGLRDQKLVGFEVDSYVNYGRDQQAYRTEDSDNPSYGLLSPTSFYDGSSIVSELVVGTKASREIPIIWLPQPLQVEISGEYRHDTFQLLQGQTQSWADGGQAILDGPDDGKAAISGASDHAGTPPFAATQVARDVFDGQANASIHVTPAWEWTVGGHVVNYSDTTTVMTGAIGTRYNFGPRWALRGDFSTGYRPPTLAQTNFFYAAPFPGYEIDQLPNHGAAAQALGAGNLKGEYSRSYSVGVDATPVSNWHITGNLYVISINDRLADTSTFGGSAVENILVQNGLADVDFATYYANPVNTRSYGGDLDGNYTFKSRKWGEFRLQAGLNITDNEITHFNQTPDVLQQLNQQYFNSPAQNNLLHSAPKNREEASFTWTYDRFTVGLQEERYGSLVFIASPSLPSSLWTDQRPALITNLKLGYAITPRWTLDIGADNLTNKYPTEVAPAAIKGLLNAVKYSYYSPYGFNGGMYFVDTSIRF